MTQADATGAASKLGPIPEGVGPEDMRKLVYIREQVAREDRDRRDIDSLTVTYRDIVRRIKR